LPAEASPLVSIKANKRRIGSSKCGQIWLKRLKKDLFFAKKGAKMTGFCSCSDGRKDGK
jgi:hypothetical protein